MVFQVEIHLSDEEALTEKMAAMREWLDHRRFEPLIFRYTFEHRGMLFRVDFAIQAEAVVFAKEFGGNVVTPIREMPSQAAD
jgi:hypothetical protein